LVSTPGEFVAHRCFSGSGSTFNEEVFSTHTEQYPDATVDASATFLRR
jgi:hypothetical protein